MHAFFFDETATTEIYTYGHTLALHDALPIFSAADEESLGPIAQERLEKPMIRLAVPPMLRLAAVAIVFCMAGTAARAETEAEALVTEARLTVDRLMADKEFFELPKFIKATRKSVV